MPADLFAPFQLGDLTLANRMVMAPMTRNRADENGVVWVPPDPLPSAVMRVVAPVVMGLATLVIAGRSLRSPRDLPHSPTDSSRPEAPDS